MTVLIQHTKTSLYWKEGAAWTPHLDEASDFGELARALDCVRSHELNDSKIVLQSATACYDIHLNLQEGDTTVRVRNDFVA